MACVVIFLISSFLCGIATSLPLLVFFRVVQGAGGGGLQPVSQAILVESFPRAKQGMAMAVYGMGVVVAPIVGPTLGGWLTDNYSWRWIFFINIPVGLLSLFLTSTLVHDPPHVTRSGNGQRLRVDYIGLGLISVGLGFLQVVLDKGQRDDWFGSNFIVWCTVVCVVSLLGAIVWEMRQKDPVVELRLFKDRNYATATFLMFLLGVVLYGSTVMLPVLLQTVVGYTAQLSGLVLSPGAMVTLVSLPIVGWLLDAVPAALAGDFWLGGLILRNVPTGLHQFDYQLLDFRLSVDDVPRRFGIFVCAHQRDGILLCAQGENEQRHRTDQSRAQHRRQRRNFHGHHDSGAAHTKAPERSRQ